MVMDYCCREVMRPWSDIDPNWLEWVRAKLGFCWIPHKSTTLPHFRIEDFITKGSPKCHPTAYHALLRQCRRTSGWSEG